MTVNPNFNNDSDNSKNTLQTYFLISLFSIIPFIIFLFFTKPCSDDIFYHNYAQGKTIWEFLVHHYNTWTGRYFSNLLMAINPFTLTSDVSFYPKMIVGLFAFYFFSLFLVLKSVIGRLTGNHSRRNRNAFFLAIMTTAIFLHKMPKTADTFYWFAGASSHLSAISFFLVAAAFYFRGLVHPNGRVRPGAVFIVSLISVIVCGSNETLAIQWIFALSFCIFYQKMIFQKWDKGLFVPLLAALVGFAFLYFAPGNAVRAKELTGGHSIVLLLFKPWGLVAETTIRYLSISLLTAVFIFFPQLKNINEQISEKIKSQKSILYLNLFGLGLFLLTFVPSVWTMGSLPPNRVLNNTYLMFLLYGTFLIILSAHRLTFLDRWSAKLKPSYGKMIFAVSLICMFNHFYAWKDLFNLPRFIEASHKRELIVSSSENKLVILPPFAYFPTTFLYEDITTKAHDYRNIVFAEFYKLKNVQLSKEYDQ